MLAKADCGAQLYREKNSRWIVDVQKNIDSLNAEEFPTNHTVYIHDVEPPIYDYNLPGFVQLYNYPVYEFIDDFKLWDILESFNTKLKEYNEAVARVSPLVVDYYATREYVPAVGYIYKEPERYFNVEPPNIAQSAPREPSRPLPLVSAPRYVYGPGDEFEEKYGLPPKPKKKWFEF